MSRCPVTCSQRAERAETMRRWKVQSALCWRVCGGSRLAQRDQELKTRLCACSHFRGGCNMCNASSAAFFRRKCSQLFLAHVTSRLAAFRLVLCMFFLVCLFCFLFPNVLQDEPVSSSCKTHHPLLEVFLSCNNEDTLSFLPLWLNHLKCGSPFSVSVWKD